jgi:hypothetical protein
LFFFQYLATKLHKVTRRREKEGNFNKKFLQGAIRKAQSAKRKANNTINAMRQALSSMRLPPGRRRQEINQERFPPPVPGSRKPGKGAVGHGSRDKTCLQPLWFVSLFFRKDLIFFVLYIIFLLILLA